MPTEARHGRTDMRLCAPAAATCKAALLLFAKPAGALCDARSSSYASTGPGVCTVGEMSFIMGENLVGVADLLSGSGMLAAHGIVPVRAGVLSGAAASAGTVGDGGGDNATICPVAPSAASCWARSSVLSPLQHWSSTARLARTAVRQQALAHHPRPQRCTSYRRHCAAAASGARARAGRTRTLSSQCIQQSVHPTPHAEASPIRAPAPTPGLAPMRCLKRSTAAPRPHPGARGRIAIALPQQ